MTIYTVLGPIDAAELGLTSMHEHLLVDCRTLFAEPPTSPPAGDRVCIENLGWLHWNNQGILDNLFPTSRGKPGSTSWSAAAGIETRRIPQRCRS